LYAASAHQALAVAFGGDPAAVALAMSGWSFWLRGQPVQAWRQAEAALGQAKAVGHSLTLAVILLLAAHVRQFRGELDAAWALGQRLVALGREQGFVFYEATGVITQGCVLVQQGELVHGAARITTGLVKYRATGTQLLLPFFLAFLAKAYLRQGQVADGLHTVGEALRLTATYFDRLRGEVLLARSSPEPPASGPVAADAEACFQQALDIARRQEAKALELRAAMSLCRLWQAQGKPDAAYALLTEIYGWFTEGFDTADLQAAKTLLKALDDLHRERQDSPYDATNAAAFPL
jgi:predicted ATPase